MRAVLLCSVLALLRLPSCLGGSPSDLLQQLFTAEDLEQLQARGGQDAPAARTGPVTYRRDGTFAMGVKTCQFYHDNRLKAVVETYAKDVPHRVYGSDAPHDDPDYNSYTIVEEDWVKQAYVPPWSEDFGRQVSDVKPTELPQLKRKLMAILRALHDKHIDDADWFLIVDDDTFVRVKPMQAYLSKLDPSKPIMVGSPVPSLPHLTPEDIQKLGFSAHCGGGAGFALSKAALRLLRPKIDRCMQDSHTLLFWYWDEVELGRCMWDFFGVECFEQGMGWGLSTFLAASNKTDSAFAKAYTPAGMEDYMWGTRRFMGGLTTEQDWTRYDDMMQQYGGWDRSGALTFHKAPPDKMALLASKFTEEVDEAWCKRFLAGDRDA